jgi:hypothetical protein
MAPGPLIRSLLGPRLARCAGRRYRAIFVDLANMAAAIATAIPLNSHLLDIGGGDGEPLNHLLALRPDLRVTTLDPGCDVGQWIESRFSGQVTRLSRTTLADYIAAAGVYPDIVLMADVLHHIPSIARADFLGSLRVLLARVPSLRIIIKDVEPNSWRAVLGFWSDRFITGDKNVSPISRENVVRILEEALGPLRHSDTDLFETDRPNYAITFFR